MILKDVMVVMDGGRPRRKGLERVMLGKPAPGEQHTFAHTLKDLTLREKRSMPRDSGVIAQCNRLRYLHSHAEGDLGVLKSYILRAEKDNLRIALLNVRNKAERIAKNMKTIEQCTAQLEAARRRVRDSNANLFSGDREAHDNI